MSPGRNEPCPCGSGQKYKRCCFLKEEPSLDQVSLKGNPTATGAGQQASPKTEENPFAALYQKMNETGQMAEIQRLMLQLPKSQLIQISQVMQQAMRGGDSANLWKGIQERLPPAIQQKMQTLMQGAMLESLRDLGQGSTSSQPSSSATSTLENASSPPPEGKGLFSRLLKGFGKKKT